MAIKTLDFNKLSKNVENLYEATTIIAKRARQLNEKYNEIIKQELGEIENEEDFEETAQIDREDIIKKFDKFPKPCKTAVDEVIENKLKFWYEEEEEKK